MKNKYPCIECFTGWGDANGNSCRDTCNKLDAYRKEYGPSGCNVCNNAYGEIDVSWIAPTDGFHHVRHYGYAKFCPMCGRKIRSW